MKTLTQHAIQAAVLLGGVGTCSRGSTDSPGSTKSKPAKGDLGEIVAEKAKSSMPQVAQFLDEKDSFYKGQNKDLHLFHDKVSFQRSYDIGVWNPQTSKWNAGDDWDNPKKCKIPKNVKELKKKLTMYFRSFNMEAHAVKKSGSELTIFFIYSDGVQGQTLVLKHLRRDKIDIRLEKRTGSVPSCKCFSGWTFIDEGTEFCLFMCQLLDRKDSVVSNDIILHLLGLNPCEKLRLGCAARDPLSALEESILSQGLEESEAVSKENDPDAAESSDAAGTSTSTGDSVGTAPPSGAVRAVSEDFSVPSLPEPAEEPTKDPHSTTESSYGPNRDGQNFHYDLRNLVNEPSFPSLKFNEL